MSFSAKAGLVVDNSKLIEWASGNGYLRVPTVREPGEYAVRGGLIDLYPVGMETPYRFDFFGWSSKASAPSMPRRSGRPAM